MNNGDYIRANLSNEAIAEYARKLFCDNDGCGQCPFALKCNETFDALEKKAGGNVDCIEVITNILKSGNDYFFYTHDKKLPLHPKGYNYNLRDYMRCCNVCGKRTKGYGLATISINGAGYSYRVLGKICPDCFPKMLKLLKIDMPDFITPDFWVENELKRFSPKKSDNSTYCHNCGKKNNPKFNYCPECGAELDK